ERERESAVVIHELLSLRGSAGRYLDFWVLDFEKDKRGHLFFVFFFRFFRFSFFRFSSSGFFLFSVGYKNWRGSESSNGLWG
ncbi:MAG: hypothetical protein Q8P67_12270, partial [archaeon]|nr:hypothetical protein [archaeon]